MIKFAVSVRVKLAYTTDNKEEDSRAAEPPCHRDTCCETRDNQQNRADNVADDGKSFHKNLRI